jgi:hypothetical protein
MNDVRIWWLKEACSAGVHHQAFGHALAFVVTRSHADRIDLTAVALAPRMLVIDWRCRTREMEDAIDFEQDRLDDVVTDEFEIAVAELVHNVGALAAEKIV